MLTEFFMSWFGAHPTLIGAIQIVLDVMILVALLLFFLQGRRQKVSSPGAEALLQGFEKIIEETRNIGREFETNLEERQLLIHQLLERLDQRVHEAQHTLNAFQQTPRAKPRTPEPGGSPPTQSDYRQVLALARGGLDAQAIATRLQKPVGEVELILNIQRLSTAR